MIKNLFITKNKFSILISAFLLILISWIVFYKAINYKTIMVEDLLFSSAYYEQFQNEDIIKKIFTTSVYFDKIKYLYRPVFVLSFYIDSKISLGKVNLKVNHITSLLLHFFCVLIFFYFLVYYCDFKLYLAFTGSLFFSVNIFSVWSAVWLSGRCDLLLFLFAFSSFIFFIKANEFENTFKKQIFLILHFILFFLSLLSKETAVSLPIVCLIYMHIKGYKLKWIYLLSYVFVYVLYYSMYSNDINLLKQFTYLFDIKKTLYTICDYLSAPFYLSSVKIVSPYNNLVIFEGISIIIFFVLAILNSKEKKTIYFYIFFAILFFLPTLLAKRVAFQGNRMYLPMAGIIISVLYIIDEFYRKNISSLRTKICTIVLIVFMFINIIYTKRVMSFAYDDNSVIKVICNEYKNDPTNRMEVRALIYFLIEYYNMYGYPEQANNIKNKFFKQKNVNKIIKF